MNLKGGFDSALYFFLHVCGLHKFGDRAILDRQRRLCYNVKKWICRENLGRLAVLFYTDNRKIPSIPRVKY